MDWQNIPLGVVLRLGPGAQDVFLSHGVAVVDQSSWPLVMFAALLGIVWCAPNTYEVMAQYQPALAHSALSGTNFGAGRFHWRPSVGWAAVLAILVVACLFNLLSSELEFLYYNF